MIYKPGQRFLWDKNDRKIIIQVIDPNHTSCTVKCIQIAGGNLTWYIGEIYEMSLDNLSSWSYLTGQDSPDEI